MFVDRGSGDRVMRMLNHIVNVKYVLVGVLRTRIIYFNLNINIKVE